MKVLIILNLTHHIKFSTLPHQCCTILTTLHVVHLENDYSSTKAVLPGIPQDALLDTIMLTYADNQA